MKRYTTVLLRERLAEALDAAERGEGVFIERHGVTFILQPHNVKKRTRPRPAPVIELVDPSVEAGAWTWAPTAKGVSFRRRRA